MKIEPIMVAVLTGGTVVLSKWAQGRMPNVDNAIGVAGIALALTAMKMANEKLAAGFGMLILVSVFSVYLPPLVRGLDLGSGRAPSPSTPPGTVPPGTGTPNNNGKGGVWT